MTIRQKYNHAIDRAWDLFKYGIAREKALEKELEETKSKLYHMEKCYMDAQEEIRQLRSDLYHEIGSISS